MAGDQNHSTSFESDSAIDIPSRPDWFQTPNQRSDLDSESPSWSVLWLSEWDVRVCLILGMILLGWLAIDEINRLGWNEEPITIQRSTANKARYRIDLNAGTWVEFAQLEEIGPALARRIVADRKEHGPFRSVDDLDRVAGLGPKTVAQMRPYVRVAPKMSPMRGVARPR